MMHVRIVVSAIVLLALGCTADAQAQRGMHWRGSGGWGMGSAYARIYDPKTLATVTGEVVAVDEIAPMKGMSYGVHLTLKTSDGVLSIHLGPVWYLENQEIKIEPKDQLEIRGSRIMMDGKPALVAAEVTRGDEVLKLRDDNGIPVWSGSRRK